MKPLALRLLEVGRVISAANEKKLRDALSAITAVLGALDVAQSDQTEAERSFSSRQQLIQSALRDQMKAMAGQGQEPMYCWVADVFDDYAVYSQGGEYYSVPYTIADNGLVTLGDASEVIPRMVYDPAPDAAEDGAMEAYRIFERDIPQAARKEMAASDFAGKGRSFPIMKPMDVAAAAASLGRAGSDNFSTDQIKANIIKIAKRKGAAFMAKLPKAWMEKPASEAGMIDLELIGDFVPLVESDSLRESAQARLRLIAPGWGSSGFYPPEVLQRDGPAVFKAGTQMFWNHPTPKEEAERPEGSLEKLAAVLQEDAAWDGAGPAGPGLYSTAKVFDEFKAPLLELADHIGVSIRASGSSRPGEAAGRNGPIIERISSARSVDFVTRAGAGGKVLSLFEAAGRKPVAPTQAAPSRDTNQEQDEMSEAEYKALREAAAAQSAEIKRLKEALVLRDARDLAVRTLTALDLPQITRERLIESLSRNPVLTAEGDLDVTATTTRITEAATAEAKYVASLTGQGGVRGMNSNQQTGEVTAEEAEKRLKASFLGIGLSESAAALAARGRG